MTIRKRPPAGPPDRNKPRAESASRYEEFKAEWEQQRRKRAGPARTGPASPEKLEVRRRPSGQGTFAFGWVERREPPALGGGNWLVDMPDLPQNASTFVATLRVLAFHTQDRRFSELRRDLMDSDLINAKGRWSRYGVALANPEAQTLCRAMADRIKADVREREVFAEAAVVFGVDGPSFEAVVQGLRRLLREWRKRF